MAISKVFYQILRDLRRSGVVEPGVDLLEIGQANYYGDMDPREMLADTDDPQLRDRISSFIDREPTADDLFSLAAIVNEVLFHPCGIASIDLGGNESAWKIDLNNSVPCGDSWGYDLIINHGTAEHIFNIANVFGLIHHWTLTGGLMIHESPFTGWIDHGFYCLQPTLFYDLASANNYRIEYMAAANLKTGQKVQFTSREGVSRAAKDGQIPDNANLFVCFRKLFESEFRIPMQGAYSNASQEVKEAWVSLR